MNVIFSGGEWSKSGCALDLTHWVLVLGQFFTDKDAKSSQPTRTKLLSVIYPALLLWIKKLS